jgi:hypothetical protein
MDHTALLLAIASLSASFVAILGGFIASRLITINSERASCLSQLQNVIDKLFYHEEMRSMLDKSLNEEDAIRFIYNHMAEFVEGDNIGDVYEDTELQSIDLDDLEPLWERAQTIMERFDEHLQNNGYGAFNSDWIPVEIAEEYANDIFAYEICKLYTSWGLGEHDFENTPFRDTGNWYERDSQKALEHTKEITFLRQQKEQYLISLNALKQPTGMKSGLILFALFSLCNIILPLTLSLFRFAEPFSTIGAVASIVFLTLGLVATFFYLAWMLRWKKEDESQLKYQNLKIDVMERIRNKGIFSEVD